MREGLEIPGPDNTPEERLRCARTWLSDYLTLREAGLKDLSQQALMRVHAALMGLEPGHP